MSVCTRRQVSRPDEPRRLSIQSGSGSDTLCASGGDIFFPYFLNPHTKNDAKEYLKRLALLKPTTETQLSCSCAASDSFSRILTNADDTHTLVLTVFACIFSPFWFMVWFMAFLYTVLLEPSI